jgi:hypothetical protein
MGAKIIHKIEWDGKDLEINQVASKLNTTYSNISYYVRILGLTNKKDLLAKMKKVADKDGARVEATKHKFPLGKMSVSEFWKIHPYKNEVSEQSLRGRMNRQGAESPSMLYPKLGNKAFTERMFKEGLIKVMPVKKHTKPAPKITTTLDRKRCVVGGNLCCHYSSCTDWICFERKLHPRCKPDYSCHRESSDFNINSKNGGVVPNSPSRSYGGYST